MDTSRADNNRHSAEAFSPGDFIQEELEARGWKQEDFAAILGKPLSTVNGIINGKKAIVPETAKKIAAAFGNSPQFWMNLETAWQLYNHDCPDEDRVRNRAKLYDLIPIREMQRRGWIKPAKSAEDLEKELSTFFGVSSLVDNPEELAQAARMSAQGETALAAVYAWGRRAFQVAQLVHAGKFIKSRIPNLIEQLRRLFGDPEEIRHIPKVLAEFGIRFVIVEHLRGTRLDGACISNDENRPVVSVTLRYGRLDHFWFTLIHEIAHIYYGDGSRWDIEILEKKSEDDVEMRADEFAASTLVPPNQMESFILRTTPLFSRAKIENFSRRMGVHPAIVIGQLKHRLPEEEFGWNRFTRLHNRVDVRDIIKSTATCDGWGQVAPVTS
jgi:HTH-type transcriptional regulator/antitoxin HigA